MTEELEKKVRSYKYKIEDFNPLLWGIKNYSQRISNNFTYTPEHPKELRKCRLGLIGLVSFNIAMLAGCYYLDNYLIKHL